MLLLCLSYPKKDEQIFLNIEQLGLTLDLQSQTLKKINAQMATSYTPSVEFKNAAAFLSNASSLASTPNATKLEVQILYIPSNRT